MTDLTRIYVDGAWLPSTSAESIDVVDPRTELVFATVPAGSAADVDLAVRAARAAFGSWSVTAPAVRAALLQRLHDELTARWADLVADIMLDLGTPRRVAESVQVGLPLTVLASYVDLLASPPYEERVGSSVVVREPIGVVAAITPWNYPLHQIVAKLAAALAAGCTVVAKPSEVAPLVAWQLFEAIDAAGFPPGVCNLVSGAADVGRALVDHPLVDHVSFTGSVRVGRSVAAAGGAALKRVSLELGGKSAAVVLPGADDDLLSRAVRATVASVLLNSGQTCTALSLLVVPDSFLSQAAALAGELVAERAPMLGPLASAAQWDRVQGLVSRAVSAGARVVSGGLGRPAGVETGFFVIPTVLVDVEASSEIVVTEVFGPVLVVLGYSTEDDAVLLVNASGYGLSGAVWSADLDHGVDFARRLRTGQVEINGGAFNPLAPFGGVGLSGSGRELGRHGLEEFTYLKSLQL